MKISKVINELNTVIDLIPTSSVEVHYMPNYKEANIYDIGSLEDLYKLIWKFQTDVQNNLLFRWFNFVSFKMVSELIIGCGLAKANRNKYDNTYDFTIYDYPFKIRQNKLSNMYKDNLTLALDFPEAYLSTFIEKEDKSRMVNRIYFQYSTDVAFDGVNHLKIDMDTHMALIGAYMINFDWNKLIKIDKYKYDVIFIQENENKEVSFRSLSKII